MVNVKGDEVDNSLKYSFHFHMTLQIEIADRSTSNP